MKIVSSDREPWSLVKDSLVHQQPSLESEPLVDKSPWLGSRGGSTVTLFRCVSGGKTPSLSKALRTASTLPANAACKVCVSGVFLDMPRA